MKTKNAIEINRSGGLELIEIIENWESYDTNTVILAYCELEKSNSISKDLQEKAIHSFCEENNVENISQLIKSFLKEKNCHSYEDFLKKEKQFMNKVEQLNYKKKVIDPSHIKSAGKAIKSVVYIVLIMILVVYISLYYIAFNARSYETQVNIYIFLGLFSLGCYIFILGNLYSAGNNLEKSV